MKVHPTRLPEVLLVEPEVHRDARGHFLETYHAGRYAGMGVRTAFVQHNVSVSRRGTLRGLHLQRVNPQAKLIRAVRGEVFDVAVDVRVGSPAFGSWVGMRLSEDNFLQAFVPEGFAHGFCVLSDQAEVSYLCSAFYDPADELVVSWNDPAIGIDWPLNDPVLSVRDASAPPLAALLDRLPRYAGITVASA